MAGSLNIYLRKKKTGPKGPGHGFLPGQYWDIMLPGQRAPIGFVGYIRNPVMKAKGVQVYLVPKYRGKGLATRAEDMLAEQLGVESWYAAVSETNEASQRAHKRAGWRPAQRVLVKSYDNPPS